MLYLPKKGLCFLSSGMKYLSNIISSKGTPNYYNFTESFLKPIPLSYLEFVINYEYQYYNSNSIPSSTPYPFIPPLDCTFLYKLLFIQYLHI